MQYSFPILIDLSKAIPEVDELCKSVNLNLSTFGVDESLTISGAIGSVVLSVDRQLTPNQLEDIRAMIDLTIKSSSLSVFGASVGTNCSQSVSLSSKPC